MIAVASIAHASWPVRRGALFLHLAALVAGFGAVLVVDLHAVLWLVGRSLTRVDAYATAAFAMGADALRWIERLPGYEGLVVSDEGSVTSTPGFLGVGPPD